MTERRRPAPLGVLLIAAGAVLGIAAIALVARGSTAAPAATVPAISPVSQSATDPDAYAAQLQQAADDARTATGLPRLAPAPCAAPVARERAAALVGRPLEHAPLDDLRVACAPATTDAENLSRAAAAPADVLAAWLASPGHRANILDPALTAMTVACVHDGDAMLCSQLFTGP